MARLWPLRLSGTHPSPAAARGPGLRRRLVELAWRLNGARPINEVPREDMELLFSSTRL